MLRRASFTGGPGLTGPSNEPLIVVEESGAELEEEGAAAFIAPPTPPLDSPGALQNPYLLSPYRDLRKRSLPTPQCTSGITASQVRRLSEQGGEGKGPSAREAAFLATLSTAPVPQAGGRRHSVVTISRAPPTSVLFGRNRRESIAAFPTGLPLTGRLSRKDSSSSIARSPSLSGSNFNLQLDIMDDIAEIKTPRKVQMKMWQNEKEEKICEIQPVEGGAAPQRYQAPPRRSSEIVQPTAPLAVQKGPRRASGIVCSNTDLISIMSSLTSSAQEINTETGKSTDTQATITKPLSTLDQRRSVLKGSRSNSFDVSLLPEGKEQQGPNWFARRHQPMANKKYLTPRPSNDQNQQQDGSSPPVTTKPPVAVTFADERQNTSLIDKKKQTIEESQELKKVVWDKPTGSVIDAQLIGSAIEVYLNQKVGGEPSSSSQSQNQQISSEQDQSSSNNTNTSKTTSWFGNKTKQPDEDEGTRDNSLCSTLKDLFVK
ncbi:uncharacterized protein LOC142320984 [Lycorma delicatula]|uniref:uncharacterized protein LOC142320984 n=1 Tax=Lycorma delicatula TaxID=130591 RepID=UPI003F5103FD